MNAKAYELQMCSTEKCVAVLGSNKPSVLQGGNGRICAASCAHVQYMQLNNSGGVNKGAMRDTKDCQN